MRTFHHDVWGHDFPQAYDGASPGDALLSSGFASSGQTLFTPGLAQQDSNGQHFYQTDALGSVRGVSGNNQAPQGEVYYDAFGLPSVRQGSQPSPLGFAGAAGYQTDADTGLMLLGNRYYDPSIGRFLSPDPAGAGDNWYAYCDNAPLDALDPTGLDEVPNPGMDEGGIPNVTGNEQIGDTFVDNTGTRWTYEASWYYNSDGGTTPYTGWGSPGPTSGPSETIPLASTVTQLAQLGNQQLTGGNAGKAAAAFSQGNYGAAAGFFGAGVAVTMMTITPQGREGKAATLAANKIAGDGFRDLIAGLLRNAGHDARIEQTIPTPLGNRRLDIGIFKDGSLVSGIETKLGNARYGPSQRAKDWYLRHIMKIPVDVVRHP